METEILKPLNIDQHSIEPHKIGFLNFWYSWREG